MGDNTVEVRNVDGRRDRAGRGGPFTLVIDRPEAAGGGGSRASS